MSDKKMNRFDVNEVFSQYIENDDLEMADIFHLYDTGEECMPDNSGYHDSRHFRLVAFNTHTMEKRDCGRHDSIDVLSDSLQVRTLRVYADGSFFVKFFRPAKMVIFDDVILK